MQPQELFTRNQRFVMWRKKVIAQGNNIYFDKNE